MNDIQRDETGEVSLIDIIQIREKNIDATEMELQKLWMNQGADLQRPGGFVWKFTNLKEVA